MTGFPENQKFLYFSPNLTEKLNLGVYNEISIVIQILESSSIDFKIIDFQKSLLLFH